MSTRDNKYADFVEHPRYGRSPRYTGLNPNPLSSGVHLHWRAQTPDEIAQKHEAIFGEPWPYGGLGKGESPKTTRIPNTAIEADLTRQSSSPVGVTHYFDMPRVCRDCGRPFIFFAAEQKHWYEELSFPLDSDCVRCTDCRRHEREIAKLRKRFEELIQVANRTVEQTCEMADCCVSLMEEGVFTIKQSQRVRALLNSIPADAEVRRRARFTDLVARVKAIENRPTG